jgi:hypothetical protein
LSPGSIRYDKPSELAPFLRCAIDGTPAACCRFARELDEQADLNPAVRAKIHLYLRKCAPAGDVSDAFYISRQTGRWQSSKPAHLGMLETLTTVNVTDLMFDGSISVISGKLKGLHRFANVVHASRKRE